MLLSVLPSFSTRQLLSAAHRKMRRSLAPVCGPPPGAWTPVTTRSPGLRSLAWSGNSSACACAPPKPSVIAMAAAVDLVFIAPILFICFRSIYLRRMPSILPLLERQVFVVHKICPDALGGLAEELSELRLP